MLRCELGAEQLQLEQLLHLPVRVTLPAPPSALRLCWVTTSLKFPFCQQPRTWAAPQTHSQPWQLLIDFSNNTNSNSHDPSPVLHTNNSHPHTQVTTPLYSKSNCSSNTKCFLLLSVYIWVKSLWLSGKMGIKQINYRNSPSIKRLDAADRTTNSHCRNQQLHKPDPSRKGLCCAAGVYNLCITNIITSMTLIGSYLFVCKNSSEAFQGVTFSLSSILPIILGS